jgi:hypothetical protein
MNAALRAFAASQNGVVLTSQAHDAGYNNHEIWAYRRSGLWTRLRRGAYVETETWNKLDDVGRYRLLVIAVVLQLNVPAVPSHQSAAALLGLPLWNIDLTTVHVTRRDLHSSRNEAHVHHHAAELPEDDLVTVDGIVVTNAIRTSIDIAREQKFEEAVVVADGALACVGNDQGLLLAQLDQMRDWPGARNAGRVVEFADGRSESVGESRQRVQFERIGLPRPELQVVIVSPGGYEDRTDFLFREFRTIGEFDGKSKYTEFLRPGEDPAEAVWREKRREDRLRGQGYEMVRGGWADLSQDVVVKRRHLEAFERGRRRG